VPGMTRTAHARGSRSTAPRRCSARAIAARAATTLLSVLLLAAAAVLGAVAGSGRGAGAAEATRSAVATVQCTRSTPTTAAGYQRMFDSLYGVWAGGDQALSVALPGGRTLWIFADTISARRSATGGYARGLRMRHNSFVIQNRGCLTPVDSTPLPDIDPTHWYWPNSAIVSGGRLYIFAMRVRHNSTGWGGFSTYGASVATFSLPRTGVPRLQAVASLPAGNSDGSILWGAGVVAQGPWVYVYGTQGVPIAQGAGRRMLVARVPAVRLGDPHALQFYGPGAFNPAAASARPVIAARGGVSTSVSVLPAAGGGVTVVSKRSEVFGRYVAEWTAPTPAGPFTLANATLLSAPSLTRPGELLYTPQTHRESRLAGGALLVTICRNNTVFKTLQANGLLYRPQFAAVPQPR